jgi:threonine dehydrogenase-like Zn-dependent dehydrogenase
VLVTGPGPIGFAAVLACLSRSWPATLYGRDDAESYRACLARDLGAAWLTHEQARFDQRDDEHECFDLVLECTGSDEVMVAAARGLAPRGAMVWLGSSRRPQPVAHNVAQLMRDGLLRNHVHIGSVNAAPRDFEAALRHLDQLRATHPGALARLFTERVAPRDSLWHFEHREPDGIKVVLEFPT